jgi:cellulose synthase/poly-beta-1,6-N-acetylglucosamine synthase-like glycosyltransferase
MISVIIPAHNEEAYIIRCLEGLARQQTKFLYEVIVINNGSTDGTRERVLAFAQAHPAVSLRLIDEPRVGIASACQRGVEAARYPILARTDADSCPVSSWIERIGLNFQNPVVMSLGGKVIYAGHPLLSKLSNTLHWWHAYKGVPHYQGANMAVRQTALKTVGGFAQPQLAAEDLDLSLRLHRAFTQPQAFAFDQHLIVVTSCRKFHRGLETVTVLSRLFRHYVTFLWSSLLTRWGGILVRDK